MHTHQKDARRCRLSARLTSSCLALKMVSAPALSRGGCRRAPSSFRFSLSLRDTCRLFSSAHHPSIAHFSATLSPSAEGAAAPAAKKPRVTKADAGAPAAKKPAAPRGKKEPEEVFEEGASLERNRMMAELISALAADRKAKEDVWGSRGLAKAADALRGAEFPITSAKQAQGA